MASLDLSISSRPPVAGGSDNVYSHPPGCRQFLGIWQAELVLRCGFLFGQERKEKKEKKRGREQTDR